MKAIPAHWVRYGCAVLVGALAGAAVAWSATVLFASPPEVLDEAEFATAESAIGEVGSSVTLGVTAGWPSTIGGTNQALGTVTSVDVAAGAIVEQGDVLYSVDLRPVIAAVGAVPSFRTLAIGAEGADVTQLQQLLSDLGHFRSAHDGKFTRATESAVKTWQRSLKLTADGRVQPGDLIFAPSLPSRIALDDTVVTPGARLEGGEPVLAMLAGEPEFGLHLDATQAAAIPSGSRVLITSPAGHEWIALTGERRSEENEVVVAVAGAPDVSICGAHCDEIPAVGATLLRSRVVTLEPQKGVVVPTAALVTGADGGVAVVDAAGSRHPVEVTASASGMTLVNGIAPGLRVQLAAQKG